MSSQWLVSSISTVRGGVPVGESCTSSTAEVLVVETASMRSGGPGTTGYERVGWREKSRGRKEEGREGKEEKTGKSRSEGRRGIEEDEMSRLIDCCDTCYSIAAVVHHNNIILCILSYGLSHILDTVPLT